MRPGRLLAPCAAGLLALAGTASSAPAPNGTIAYSCVGICTVSADGTHGATVGTGPGTDPAWSPDGSELAFVSTRDGDSAIYLMDARGTDARRVTPAGLQAFELSWSSTGRIAFYGRTADTDGLFLIDANGAGLREVLSNDQPSVLYGMDPAISPDGTMIAFTGSQNATIANQTPTDGIYVMQSDGTERQRVATGDAPAWSPDGKQLAFTATDPSGQPQLVVSAADGTGTRTVATLASCGTDLAPAWSPDGQWLAYVSCPSPEGGQLFVVGAAGGTPIRLAFGVDPTGIDWRPQAPAAPGTPVPAAAARAIKTHVPARYAYIPHRIPAGWRYVSWDAGRATPALFPRGKGLNIWFAAGQSSLPGPGLHVFTVRTCSLRGAMKTFRVNGTRVAWSATYADGQAWRCVAGPARSMIEIIASGDGIGTSSAAAARAYATELARLVASARRV
jgi:WD40-like Beta Propeller Repeat